MGSVARAFIRIYSRKASSAQVNKVIRQASFIAAALAQYTANKSGLDVLDDGDLNGFITKMSSAFGKDYQALDATLTALAGLATGANKLPYFTGTDKAAQTDLTKVGRDIIGKILLMTFSHTLVWEMAPGGLYSVRCLKAQVHTLRQKAQNLLLLKLLVVVGPVVVVRSVIPIMLLGGGGCPGVC